MTTQTRTAPAGMTFALDGRRHHKLMDAASARRLPPIYSQDGKPETEKIAQVKLFCPYSDQRWYILEMNPGDPQVFGFTTTRDNDPEYCYIDLDELGNAVFFHGIPAIERDLHYTPLTIAQIRAGAY